MYSLSWEVQVNHKYSKIHIILFYTDPIALYGTCILIYILRINLLTSVLAHKWIYLDNLLRKITHTTSLLITNTIPVAQKIFRLIITLKQKLENILQRNRELTFSIYLNIQTRRSSLTILAIAHEGKNARGRYFKIYLLPFVHKVV